LINTILNFIKISIIKHSIKGKDIKRCVKSVWPNMSKGYMYLNSEDQLFIYKAWSVPIKIKILIPCANQTLPEYTITAFNIHDHAQSTSLIIFHLMIWNASVNIT